jgi:hypothetical protein
VRGGLKKNSKWILSFLTTLAGVLLIVYLVPFGEIVNALKRLEPWRVFLALWLYWGSYLFRTFRWKYYYPRAPLGRLFFTTSVNTLLNNLLPARLGELSIFALLRGYDKDIKETAGKFLKVRLLDAFALLTFFTFAVLAVQFNPLLALPVALSLYPLAVLLWNRLPLPQRLPRLKMDAIPFALSLGALLSKLLAVYLLLHFIPLDFFRFSIGFIGGEISTVLPLHSVAGLGSYETAFSLSLKFFTGESFKKGFEIGFLSHAFLLFASLILGLVSLLFLRGRP